ncbi:putative acetyltransferase [Ananas comosus]|uniref:Putative acetyltransferase n=1 Tax=Ananas comosus TaxID=4615 RepID=A0A199USV4_ANACO|nr:putative acetyltransferase [Ananas comosus]
MPYSRPSPTVHTISTCTVKPPPRPRRICHLTPWDIAMLSTHYIQKGLLFANPPSSSSLNPKQLIEQLKSSLSVALLQFYQLAGRLVTEEDRDADSEVKSTSVYIDCNGQGVEFVHAAADRIKVADVLALSGDLPKFLHDFFQLDGAVNHHGHFSPLLSVQLTELADGVFLGCSFNHVVGDGTSYWKFFNAWAEIARAADGGGGGLSRPPVHDRWFVDGYGAPPLKLPLTDPSRFLERFAPPPLRERMFHFSREAVARLKARANEECGRGDLSSFQSLSALLWRAVTRARGLAPGQATSCRVAIENRARLRPPLAKEYFGNSIYVVAASATAGELLAQGIGWAAALVNRAVAEHTDTEIRAKLGAWMARPFVFTLREFYENSVMVGSSPRFDMYGCEFGWGRAVAARSGGANKFDGKIAMYPGWGGGGSMDVELCLVPENMAALERDEEFMGAVSPPVEMEVLLEGIN